MQSAELVTPLGSAHCWSGRDPRTQTRFRTLRVFGSVGQPPITPAPRPESALLVVDGRGSGWADDATMRELGDERGARPIRVSHVRVVAVLGPARGFAAFWARRVTRLPAFRLWWTGWASE
jgi:hypothetical protein